MIYSAAIVRMKICTLLSGVVVPLSMRSLLSSFPSCTASSSIIHDSHQFLSSFISGMDTLTTSRRLSTLQAAHMLRLLTSIFHCMFLTAAMFSYKVKCQLFVACLLSTCIVNLAISASSYPLPLSLSLSDNHIKPYSSLL